MDSQIKKFNQESVNLPYQNQSNSRVLGPQPYIVDLENENGKVGLLLSSKAILQLGFNPVVGYWTARSRCSIPLFTGTIVLLLSIILFAAGDSYPTMFLARASQGLASSCIGITGMSLIAGTHMEPRRSRAMGFALSSAALGVLLGYPFGGFMYDLVGKTPPFLIISVIVFALAVIQFYNLDLATSGNKWQLGTAFIPDSLGYALGTNVFSQIAYREGRTRIAVLAMIVVGMSCLAIPLASSMIQLVVPHFLLGLGIGAVDAALVPLLASLADAKNSKSYGAVYAIQQIVVSLAYALGPICGGVLVHNIGFPWLMTCVGLINFFYCPILATLKPIESDNDDLLQDLRLSKKYESSGDRVLYNKFHGECGQ